MIRADDAAQLAKFDARPDVKAVVVADDGGGRAWRQATGSLDNARRDMKRFQWPGAVLCRRAKGGWQVVS